MRRLLLGIALLGGWTASQATSAVALPVSGPPPVAAHNEVVLEPNTEETVRVETPGAAATTMTLKDPVRVVTPRESEEAGKVLKQQERISGSVKPAIQVREERSSPTLASAARAKGVRFKVLSKRYLPGYKKPGVASASNYIGNHEWWGVGLQQCSSGGCWFWNETAYVYALWYNGYESWYNPSQAWSDPWHCNGDGFSCTVLWQGGNQWNPAYYGYGEHLTYRVAFQTAFGYPWGSTNASHWLEMDFYGDGYVGYHVGG